MINKVRVYGKAQNRTALGIVNAYLVINPQTTLADLRETFPNSLNPDSGVKQNFVDMNEIATAQGENWNGYFTADDELMHLADGTTVALVKMWTKPSFERLVARAADNAIEIAQFTEADKGAGRKGGYRLEYINGFDPTPVPVEEPKKRGWLLPIVIIGLVAVAGIAYFALNGKGDKPALVEAPRDTVQVRQMEQVEEIEKDFNAAKFEQGKAELNDESKAALNDLADFMKQHAALKVHIVGHASTEGSEQKNVELSEARAKAAVDYLVGQGIDEGRLRYEGKGSSEPVDPNRPELNRRTEFIVEK